MFENPFRQGGLRNTLPSVVQAARRGRRTLRTIACGMLSSRWLLNADILWPISGNADSIHDRHMYIKHSLNIIASGCFRCISLWTGSSGGLRSAAGRQAGRQAGRRIFTTETERGTQRTTEKHRCICCSDRAERPFYGMDRSPFPANSVARETAVLILVIVAAIMFLVMVREGASSMFFGGLEQIKTWMAHLRAP